jgi:hypothetical protein
MSYFLFIDESGHDQRDSPYEVLAGVAVQDRDLWNLISAVHRAEIDHFGRRYTDGKRELKGKKLLDRRTFHLADQAPPIVPEERAALARQALEEGANVRGHQLTALAQSKIGFAREALILAARFRCKCFASIVDRDAPRPLADYLRKDYAYLFERFFYFLEDLGDQPSGILVFDEREKVASHLLLTQVHRYFRETATGRQRSSRIIPEPFFVHSDLTTGVQLADLCAYVISWGVRLTNMNRPARAELAELSGLILDLRHNSTREAEDRQVYRIWSFKVIDDLRARVERGV